MKHIYTTPATDMGKTPYEIEGMKKKEKENSRLVITLLTLGTLGIGAGAAQQYYTNYEQPANFIQEYKGEDISKMSFKEFSEKYDLPRNQVTKDAYEKRQSELE